MKKARKKDSARSVARKSVAPVAPSASRFALSPLGDRVVLREVQDAAEKTSAGIYLPESAQDKETKKGTVVAVGPGRFEDGMRTPMTLKVGDVVIYSWGDKVKVGGVEYTIVRESDVTALVCE